MSHHTINKDDLTIVIQGPAHIHSINNLNNYFKFASKIIMSCYGTCDIEIDKNNYKDKGSLIVLKNTLPQIPCFNGLSGYYHSFSTLQGLSVVSSSFTIKVRSDEYYSDLTKFTEVMARNPNCWTTNNIFFKRADKEPFHPSDHVIGGNSFALRQAFAYAKKLYEDNLDLPGQWFDGRRLGLTNLSLSPEAVFFLSFLITQGVNLKTEAMNLDGTLNINNVRYLTKKYAKVVTLEEMGSFLFACANARDNEGKGTGHTHYCDTTWLYTSSPETPSIKSMDEV